MKMHDLKMTDKVVKNNGVWKRTNWKMAVIIAFPVAL